MKTIGRRKCDVLKELRKKIAEENGIPYVEHECHETRECSGSCPMCDIELMKLQKEIDKKKDVKKQRAAAAAMISGLLASAALTSCGTAPAQIQLTGDSIMYERTYVDSSMVGQKYTHKYSKIGEGIDTIDYYYDPIAYEQNIDSVTISITPEMIGDCMGEDRYNYFDESCIDPKSAFGKAIEVAKRKKKKK